MNECTEALGGDGAVCGEAWAESGVWAITGQSPRQEDSHNWVGLLAESSRVQTQNGTVVKGKSRQISRPGGTGIVEGSLR